MREHPDRRRTAVRAAAGVAVLVLGGGVVAIAAAAGSAHPTVRTDRRAGGGRLAVQGLPAPTAAPSTAATPSTGPILPRASGPGSAGTRAPATPASPGPAGAPSPGGTASGTPATPARPTAPARQPALALPPAWGTVGGAPGTGPRTPPGAVALTFDDGPDPTWTPQVLQVLGRYHASATFFDVGVQVARYPALARAEYAAGNGVGSHTWSHPDLTKLPAASVADQLDRSVAVITAATGHRPTCLRPPFDAIDPAVRTITAGRALAMMLYDVDPQDWARPGAQQIAARVLAAVHPGAIVDLHDAGGDRSETLAALPTILQGLRARQLTPVALCR